MKHLTDTIGNRLKQPIYVFLQLHIIFLPGNFSFLLRFRDCIFLISFFQNLEIIFQFFLVQLIRCFHLL